MDPYYSDSTTVPPRQHRGPSLSRVPLSCMRISAPRQPAACSRRGGARATSLASPQASLRAPSSIISPPNPYPYRAPSREVLPPGRLAHAFQRRRGRAISPVLSLACACAFAFAAVLDKAGTESVGTGVLYGSEMRGDGADALDAGGARPEPPGGGAPQAPIQTVCLCLPFPAVLHRALPASRRV